MKRVNVVGTSGSGKSTFARQLAKKLNCAHIELDRLHWRPNWTEASAEEFESLLDPLLIPESWVVDGNYTTVMQRKWTQVDTVIWLDHSFSVTVFRACKRACGRIWRGQEVWPGTGNVETFRRTFCSRNSIILWSIITWRRNRQKYSQLINDPRWSHIHFIRLKEEKSTQAFLRQLVRGQQK